MIKTNLCANLLIDPITQFDYSKPIPVVIHEEITKSNYFHQQIHWAFNEFRQKTLVSFQETPATSQKPYFIEIYLSPDGDSYSGIGLSASGTPICLSLNHFENPSSILHELMHCLGFGHEHQRPDRHKYVHVSPHAGIDYDVLSYICIGTYDPASVMHYKWDEYLSPIKGVLSQQQIDYLKQYPKTFSSGDIVAINFLVRDYQCSFKETGRDLVDQSYYECITCWGKDSPMRCCVACRYKCHAKHKVIEHKPGKDTFYCNCGANGCTMRCTSNDLSENKSFLQPVYGCLSCNLENVCHPCYKLKHSSHRVRNLGRKNIICGNKHPRL